jgi:hypothetical protein
MKNALSLFTTGFSACASQMFPYNTSAQLVLPCNSVEQALAGDMIRMGIQLHLAMEETKGSPLKQMELEFPK